MKSNRCIHWFLRCTCRQQARLFHLLFWHQYLLTHFWPVHLDSYSPWHRIFLDLSSGEFLTHCAKNARVFLYHSILYFFVEYDHPYTVWCQFLMACWDIVQIIKENLFSLTLFILGTRKEIFRQIFWKLSTSTPCLPSYLKGDKIGNSGKVTPNLAFHLYLVPVLNILSLWFYTDKSLQMPSLVK